MNWIKADYRFDDRRAVFYVTQKQMAIERFVFECLQKADDPVGLENAVLEIIKKYRPELAGCCLFHMGFNANYGRWEFAVAHGSLPRVKLYDECPRRPLDPAYERELTYLAEAIATTTSG